MTAIRINAPMTIMMMAMATIPYIKVVCEAIPVAGVAVGGEVAAGELAWIYVEAEEA